MLSAQERFTKDKFNLHSLASVEWYNFSSMGNKAKPSHTKDVAELLDLSGEGWFLPFIQFVHVGITILVL